MSRVLDRLGRFCARRHWIVLGLWVVLAAGLAIANAAADGQPVDTYSIPGSQSQEAGDLLEEHFPSASGNTARVVYKDSDGVCSDDLAPAIARSVKRINKLPHVTAAVDPCQPPFNTEFVSSSGDLAYTTIQYDVDAQDVGTDALDLLEEADEPATNNGIRVEYGGAVIDYVNADTSSTDSDAIGLVAAAVILAFAFGSLVAMMLPIGTALFGLSVGLTLIYLLSATTAVGTLAPIFGTMIGLGVGIDYSLFVVTRHRQNMAEGMDLEASVAHAVGTSGSAVVFAGVTVIIAITGLRLAQLPYITTLGDTAAIVVAVMVLAAITLLPALIRLVGRHIDSLRVPTLGGRSEDPAHNIWARMARTVCRRPWVFGTAAVLLLVVLALPLRSMELGIADDGTDPKSTTQRQAYDLLTEGFGPGVNGPLLVTVSIPKDATGVDQELATIESDIQATKDVASVFPPQTSPDGRVAIFFVTPDSAPESGRTESLVTDLRDKVLPDATSGTDLEALVGGVTAAYVDLSDRVQSRLPWFIGAVVLLSFLVLMFAFHSVVVPLTAAIMNLLSVGAAYGIVVAIFQFGWGRGLLGVEQEVPISPFVPMMMFAILFGLSMDYQVFLLTRVREEYDHSGDGRASVVNGVAGTARVITSAALIMIAVFASFLLDPQPTVKMFGLGLAAAVFIDATVVRLVLVPSVMEILGRANWWLPRWLDRILPRVALD
jgi:putative drug exporter of the RND superfamily